MRAIVRHISVCTLLFAYALAAFGGSALHSLVHDCSTDVETTVPLHAHCDHEHGDSAPGQVPQERDDHDEHTCQICHYLGQAQTEISSTELIVLVEPLWEASRTSVAQTSRWIPQSYDSRGPPV